MESEAHSICEHCVQTYAKYGVTFVGTIGRRMECCFCGHPHESGQMMRLDDAPDGQRVRPWWCGDVLGIHREVRHVA